MEGSQWAGDYRVSVTTSSFLALVARFACQLVLPVDRSNAFAVLCVWDQGHSISLVLLEVPMELAAFDESLSGL